MSWSTNASLDDSFKFTVIPLSKGGQGGLRTSKADEFPIDVVIVPPAVEPGASPDLRDRRR